MNHHNVSGGALSCLDLKLWGSQLAVEPEQKPSNGDRHIHFQMSLKAQSMAMLLGMSMGGGEKPEA